MKKKWLWLIIFSILLVLLLVGAYQLMNARTFQLFGGLTDRVETEQKVVALTFDDGPTENVEELLPLLEKYEAKATFFLIGKDIEEHPEEAEQIVKAGHQVGNHTYSHERMIFKSPSAIAEEIEKTDELIRQAGYDKEIDFRPPNGKKLIGLPYYLNKHQRETIMWNLEPDSYHNTASGKVSYVKEQVTPGSIILMHPMYDRTGETLKAVEGILKTLSDEGYTFVTVNELQKQ
ncbi:polysaccharide deacetylase family protein [Bacillus thermotolerans]|uniref:Polysaccharide deacetylase n=1 Tax=Bacillus thermotolerans TaxID=1221996 RepID=A0A0F5I7W7_BACTR|nr:polysaccharide deacetylase family protein [Bacillus thermotolerans]KKB41533.1 Polysaccharide deacetylase [Bacillus thermotolerans]